MTTCCCSRFAASFGQILGSRSGPVVNVKLHLASLPSADAAGAADRYPASLQSLCFCCAWLEASDLMVQVGPNNLSYLIGMPCTVPTLDTFENALLSQ